MSVDVDGAESGWYVVRWDVIGADTHPGRGRFAFHVGAAAGDVPNLDLAATTDDVAPLGLALQVVSRWLHFIGYALSFGVIAFEWFVLRIRPSKAVAATRLRRLVLVGLALLIVAEPLALIGQTASLGASQVFDPDSISAALDSSFGRVLSLRLGAAFLIWTLLGIANDGASWSGPAALVVGGALAIVDGTSAHALSVQPTWLGLTVNALHLLAAGGWVGGLAAMSLTSQTITGAIDRKVLVNRIGRLAGVSVVMLIVAGGLMAWWHLSGAGSGLVAGLQTDYGRVLAFKVFLVFATLAVAAWASRRRPGELSVWRVAEFVGLIVVLGLAGLVVTLRPPS
jgi:copper transport protein